MSNDFYEDLANEMGNTDRYIQPDEEEEFTTKELRDMLKNKVYTLPRPYVTEDYLAARSPNKYQGPSAHDSMDNLRRPFLVLKWKHLLWTGALIFAGAIWALVAILKDLQP